MTPDLFNVRPDWASNPPELEWPTIDSTLLDAGIDPHRTPVDRLPEAAQWALANAVFGWETDTSDDIRNSDINY